jgi:lipoprotein-anchoring transpeptidase ErfK/SrfK
MDKQWPSRAGWAYVLVAVAGEEMIASFRTTALSRSDGSAWLRLAAGVLIGFAALLGSARPGIPAPQGDEDRPGYVPTEAEEQLPNELRRQMVLFRTTETPGTIIVHTQERFLYLVQPNNRAIRYGIGVGREGFQWTGLKRIDRKAEWPDWTPPPEMIARQPYLPRFMAGGPGNPMGARALYISGTVYRIHGTNAPHTIGTAVSSGCFRLTNPELIDLYERVPIGTKVVVRQAAAL